METDTRKKKKGFRLIAWILAVLLVALVATVVFLCRDDLSLSGIRSKMQQIFGRTTLAQEYSYDGGDGCIVRVLEDLSLIHI